MQGHTVPHNFLLAAGNCFHMEDAHVSARTAGLGRIRAHVEGKGDPGELVQEEAPELCQPALAGSPAL